jgi:hypothetical protein
MSPPGQKSFLTTITNILKETAGGRGIGFFYWEPAYISVPPIGSSWEHLTTFDFGGSALGTVTAFMDFDSIAAVEVKLRVNTATNADTLKSSGVVQVRGEIKGIGSGMLPDGALLTWDSYSEVKPINVDGDYWEYRLMMYPGDRIEYKLWTGHSEAVPTYLRLGWEGPIVPADSSAVNARVHVAGAAGTTTDVQFYHSRGVPEEQNWTPFQSKPDSAGVLFRVNVNDLMKAGLFDPASHGPVTVRGDSASSGGTLSWSESRVVLQRETISVGGGSFWSGAGYFPRSRIAVGTPIEYKFFIENSLFGGLEAGIADRVFPFPAGDTTLAWRFFNDRRQVTDVDGGEPAVPVELRLEQNYPNPFNPRTTIRYALPRASRVRLSVCNVLGQEIAVLVSETQSAGHHSVEWDGRASGNQAGSGIYLLRLEADGAALVRKMAVVR